MRFELATALNMLDDNATGPLRDYLTETADDGSSSIRHAFDTLRAAHPNIPISIVPADWTYHSHSGQFYSGRWQVYLHNGRGSNNIEAFSGKTLTEAVEAALASAKEYSPCV